MQEQVIIPLDKPLTGHDGPIKRIVLREPTFDEYLAVGDPYSVASSGEGSAFAVENMDAIRRYIGLCLVEPANPDLLKQGNAKLARALKEKILGFFQVDAVTEASGTSPTSSSSGASTSKPATSKP